MNDSNQTETTGRPPTGAEPELTDRVLDAVAGGAGGSAPRPDRNPFHWARDTVAAVVGAILGDGADGPE